MVGLKIGLNFFFQAEDGIRDAQESRGLGDVYKGQLTMPPTASQGGALPPPGPVKGAAMNLAHSSGPVPYTYLTLPTIYSV